MQDNMNDPSSYYAGRPVAGRLISTRPSRVGGIRAWYERQNMAIQVGIAIVAIFIPLLTFLLAISSLTSRTQTTTPQSYNSLDSLATPVIPTELPTVAPTPSVVATPTQASVTPTPLPNAVTNPWGYDFVTPGVLITSPPPTFCNYFSCIPNFFNGLGYVIQCQDGTFSLSGGVNGSCAAHKGDLRPLYFHPAPVAAPQPTPKPQPQPTPTPIPPTPTPRPQPTPTPIPPTPTPVLQPTPIIQPTPPGNQNGQGNQNQNGQNNQNNQNNQNQNNQNQNNQNDQNNQGMRGGQNPPIKLKF